MKSVSRPPETHHELSFESLTRIADLDAELYPSSCGSSLCSELDERLGKLIEDGYEPEKASKILDVMIRKGEILKQIKEWEETKTPTAMDKKVQEEEIAKLQKELHALNDGTNVQGASKPRNSPAGRLQIALIEKVRELMQQELDTTWPDGKRGLKISVIRKHHTLLKRIYGDTPAENMADKTKPAHLKRLGIKIPLPS